MRSCSLALLAVGVVASAAHADTLSYANSTNPLAFFQLQSQGQGSSVNGYTTTYQNGASDVAGGGPETNAVSLNGDNSNPQYITTSLSGGINGAGSISAYINVAATNTSEIEYIAGESQGNNDFDFQLVYNDATSEDLCFYSDSGSYTCALIPDTTLVDKWNMVTATYNSTTHEQDVYLNGALLATNSNGAGGTKVDQFTIGYSTTFGGRDFNGLIDDVGVWDYQLDAAQVAGLYAAGSTPTSPSATPEPSSLVLFGTSILGAAGALRRRLRLNR